MPVLAVIGAAVAITVAVEVGTTLAIVAAVGATIGAVGAITNNKALMIAGGVIGAIGGIGALAQSAGIIGADAFSFGSTAAAAGEGAASGAAGSLSGIDAEIAQWSQYGADLGAATDVGTFPTNALSGSVSLEGAPTTASAGVDSVTGAYQDVSAGLNPAVSTTPDVTPVAAVDNGVTIPQGDAAVGVIDPPSQITGTAGSVPGVGAPSAPGVAAPGTPGPIAADPNATTNSILSGGQGVTGAPAPGTTVTGSVSTPSTESLINAGSGANNPGIGISRVDAGGSVWGGIKDFLKNNGTLVSGVIQAGSSFIAGATNGLTPAQIAALNAQAEANQAAANLSRMQQANMAAPLPVASRTPPVTGAPAGMINTPPRVNVTGATA